MRLTDTESLDRGALTCAVAGAVCLGFGVVTSTLAPHVDVVDWMRWTGPIAFGIACGRNRWLDRVKSLIVGGVASLTTILFDQYPLFGAAIAGGLIALVVSQEAVQRRLTAGQPHARELQAGAFAAGAIAWPLAIQGMQFVHDLAHPGAGIPAWVLDLTGGAVFGLMMGMTPAPLHVVTDRSPVDEALRKLRPALDGQLRALVMRIIDVRAHALKLLDGSRANAEARRETRRGLDGVALMSIELTDRFAAVDQVLARMPIAGIDERIQHVRAELDSSADASVRRDLDRALAALNEQRAQVERLLQSKQRLVARLQSELASLEKTEMALAVLISGDAAVTGLRLEAIGSSLGHQAQELEAEGSALQEALLIARPSLTRTT